MYDIYNKLPKLLSYGDKIYKIKIYKTSYICEIIIINY